MEFPSSGLKVEGLTGDVINEPNLKNIVSSYRSKMFDMITELNVNKSMTRMPEFYIRDLRWYHLFTSSYYYQKARKGLFLAAAFFVFKTPYSPQLRHIGVKSAYARLQQKLHKLLKMSDWSLAMIHCASVRRHESLFPETNKLNYAIEDVKIV